MHTQMVLKNTKLVRKALKRSCFFSPVLFILCVCVFTCGARLEQTIAVSSEPVLCVPHTPGPALALPQGRSALASLGTAPSAARLPRAAWPGKCCSLWAFFMESRCFLHLDQ